MFAFARHEADRSRPKLWLVFFFIFFTGEILSYFIGSRTLLVISSSMVLALKLWFDVDWGKATLITVVHLRCSRTWNGRFGFRS